MPTRLPLILTAPIPTGLHSSASVEDVTPQVLMAPPGQHPMVYRDTVSVTYQVTSLCYSDNITRYFGISTDNSIPTFTCPDENLVVVCTVPAPYTNYSAFILAGGYATDNCGIDTTTFEWVNDISDGNTKPETIIRTYRIKDYCGNEAICNQTITINDILVETWVYLEGSAIDPECMGNYTIPMRTTLNDLHVLPGQTYEYFCGDTVYTPAGQPYNTPPWNYGGNEGEGYDSGGNPNPGTAEYATTVVDWVLVSLRIAPDGGPLCQKAALLHSDGHIEFIDGGFSCCALSFSESYYVVIEHRNHLIVMSPEPLPSDGTLSFDFRSNQSYKDDSEGVVGQKEIRTDICHVCR